jgi:hypothetical protein
MLQRLSHRVASCLTYFVIIATDAELVTFELFGEVCGPSIPRAKGQGDDKDDASNQDLRLSDAAAAAGTDSRASEGGSSLRRAMSR